MPAGPETSEGVWTVFVGVFSLGGLALGAFATGFFKSFRAPERTEEKRVVLESADIADMGGMRGVGAKLTELHPAVLATNQGVAEALVILRAQEHRNAVVAEARRMRDEEKRDEERRER